MFSRRWAAKTDEALLLLIQEKQERALTELYHRYSRKMVRYFHRMLWKDDAKAQDFLHDLFIKIMENAEKIRADKKFSTWIYSVAFNMCKNEYRKQQFRLNANGKHIPDQFVLQPEVDHLDFANRLDIMLNEADESEKNLFVLKYELDLPLDEIALILECPSGTVKSRLFYLKKKLTRQLQEYNPAINESK